MSIAESAVLVILGAICAPLIAVCILAVAAAFIKK